MAILIEGYTKQELMTLPDLETLAVHGEPIVFRVGTAEFLGSFSRRERVLIVELAVVEEGGGGVLRALIDAVEEWALMHQIHAIEWIVYATSCSRPNRKLIRMLEYFGFEVQQTATNTSAYFRRVSINDSLSRRRTIR